MQLPTSSSHVGEDLDGEDMDGEDEEDMDGSYMEGEDTEEDMNEEDMYEEDEGDEEDRDEEDIDDNNGGQQCWIIHRWLLWFGIYMVKLLLAEIAHGLSKWLLSIEQHKLVAVFCLLNMYGHGWLT